MRKALDIAASVAMITAASALVWVHVIGPRLTAKATERVPKAPVAVGDSPIVGIRSARLAIIEFSDFECPFCKRFTTSTLADVVARYVDTGQALLVFKQMPLSTIHPHAATAAFSAACAARQGKFWPMHDALFEQVSLTDESIENAGVQAGLEPSSLKQCVSSHPAEVERDRKLAEEIGIASTPTFLVGRLEGNAVRVTEVLRGSRPAAEFGNALDRVSRTK